MNATDITGWVDVEGQEIFCATCNPNSKENAPIFANTETDYPNHCCTCTEVIDQAYTDACVEWMCRKLAEWLVRGEPFRHSIEQWAEALDKMHLENVEQTIVDLVRQRCAFLNNDPKPPTT